MALLTYRPIKVWPLGWDPAADLVEPKPSPFSAGWDDTMRILDSELAFLGTEEATLQIDTRPGNISANGSLRDVARVNYRGVILTFESAQYGQLTYPCNAFTAPSWRRHQDAWRHNLRAIVLGLKALRTVERYGIADRGQQYAGWAELPSGIPLGRGTMTRDQAAQFIAENTGVAKMDGGDLQWDETTAHAEAVAMAFRLASKRLHPDNPDTGDPAMFDRLVAARDLLMENATNNPNEREATLP